MDIQHCITQCTDSIVQIKENKAKASFSNGDREAYAIYDNDRCVMPKDKPRADYVIHKENVGELIVELKGRAVEDAVDQIISTYDFWRKNELFRGPQQAALIVCRQVPHAASAQRAQIKFVNHCRKKLKVATHWQERDYTSLF